MAQTAFEEDGLRTAAGHRLHGSLQRAARVFGGGELLHAVQQARVFFRLEALRGYAFES